MAGIALYQVSRTGHDGVTCREIGSHREDSFPKNYTLVAPLQVAGENFATVYIRETGRAVLYSFENTKPYLNRAGEIKLEEGLDLIEPFVIGNQPHLLCYEAEGGNFYIHQIADDLTAGFAYNFRRAHPPAPTSGFTTVKPFTSGIAMAFMGYDAESGAVAMYTLSVTATSPPGTPPLFALPVWSHEWAKGWVRFAFFQLGGSNFFLKTNKLDKRVNIDHVVDGIAGGTWEVAPAMQDQLPDNQILKFVQSFYFENGDPYFVTYKVDGTICFYRFWGNCQGFDLMASAKGPPDANCLTLFQTERSNVLLLLS